jgi:hypothetical protein
MSNITGQSCSNHRSQQRHWGKHREASRRTRSKSCTRSATFGPDRRSGSRDLGQRRQGHRICHRCDEARRSGSAHPRGRRRFRPRRCALNNAGIMPIAPIEALKVDEWDRQIDVNIKGLLYGLPLPCLTCRSRRAVTSLTWLRFSGSKCSPPAGRSTAPPRRLCAR